MFTHLIIAFLLMLADSASQEDLLATRSELLTKKEWILASYGIDENGNGVLEGFEERISDCERDNSYAFRNDGTGSYYDNFISCGDGINDYHFTWKLLEKGRTLSFSSYTGKVMKLTGNELVICDDRCDNKVFTIFRH